MSIANSLSYPELLLTGKVYPIPVPILWRSSLCWKVDSENRYMNIHCTSFLTLNWNPWAERLLVKFWMKLFIHVNFQHASLIEIYEMGLFLVCINAAKCHNTGQKCVTLYTIYLEVFQYQQMVHWSKNKLGIIFYIQNQRNNVFIIITIWWFCLYRNIVVQYFRFKCKQNAKFQDFYARSVDTMKKND
jgi:hypothetical protein